MRTTILGLSAVALAAIAAPAFAQDEAPASDITLSGGAAVVTDYRFRGISQTTENFAIQGTLTATHSSGFYVGTWGSSVDFGTITPTAEIDIYAGYSTTVGSATIDGGVNYYWYPGSHAKGFDIDMYELYLSTKFAVGPASVKVGGYYAPKQNALSIGDGREDNLYLYGDLGYSLGDIAPVTLKAHVGNSFGRSAYTLGKKSYLDWSVGADYTWKNLTLGVSYIDTSFKKSYLGSFHDNADATVVGSISVAF